MARKFLLSSSSVIAVVAALTVAPAAFAADMPAQAPVYMKAPPAVADPNWTGFYAGLGLGFRTSQTNATTTSEIENATIRNLTGVAVSQPFDGSAFRFNPYVGWNWQVAPRWVLALEGDVGFADQTTTLSGFPFSPALKALVGSNSVDDSLAIKTSWDASVRGRVGFLATPSLLVYGTGGAAWQRYQVTSTCASANFCVSDGVASVIASSATKTGWTLGGGIETAIYGNWIARADYRYADFGTAPFEVARTGTRFSDADKFNVAMRTHAATLGLAYKFGDPVASGQASSSPSGFAAASPLSWSGLYTGLGGGLRATRANATTRSEAEGSISESDSENAGLDPILVPDHLLGRALTQPLNGAAFRLAPYLGYDWQFAPQWVAGIEGDVGFANKTTTLAGFALSPGNGSSGQADSSLALKTTWDASLRGRIGFLVTPSSLVYLTGGRAWQHYDVISSACPQNNQPDVFIPGTSTCSQSAGFIPGVISNSVTRAGWTIGGGIETALTGNWFLRGEYRYADLGSSTFSITRDSFNPDPFNGGKPTLLIRTSDVFDVSMKSHIATFGIAYKFDWSAPNATR